MIDSEWQDDGTFMGYHFWVDGIEYKYGYEISTGTFHKGNISRPLMSFLRDDEGLCFACYQLNTDGVTTREHTTNGAHMPCDIEIDWEEYWKNGNIGANGDWWETIGD